ncbi:hypothetical protein GCM10022237_48520 [Nocardioides ginsengisoli]|uniref:Uncharacterized protein n=1 Tax=Nocardioides ginsengisoli TaxID=363868 RepID=A0ABW3W2S9_9ACTN
MSSKARRRLEKAAATQRLVRISRSPRHADPIDGFVVAVGRKWALVRDVVEGGYFDALVAIRVKDVTQVRKDRTFAGAFARTRPEWPPSAPLHADLRTTKGLIDSMRDLAPLVGIEQERRRGGVVWIGVPVEVDDGLLRLDQVAPDGSWRDEPHGFRFRRITKVVVGGRYQDALAATMVARE